MSWKQGAFWAVATENSSLSGPGTLTFFQLLEYTVLFSHLSRCKTQVSNLLYISPKLILHCSPSFSQFTGFEILVPLISFETDLRFTLSLFFSPPRPSRCHHVSTGYCTSDVSDRNPASSLSSIHPAQHHQYRPVFLRPILNHFTPWLKNQSRFLMHKMQLLLIWVIKLSLVLFLNTYLLGQANIPLASPVNHAHFCLFPSVSLFHHHL